MKRSMHDRKAGWTAERMAALFLALCAAMTAAYLAFGYGAYLDSDMSSELVLARHLAQKGAPVSGEWYYSTEIRLLNTQLVFAPLMALLEGSWRLVRTLGCMLLLALLAAASLFAARRLGASRVYARVFAGLNLCVVSPLYAQNVIIGAYYIPHAALCMLLMGLAAGYLRHPGKGRAAAVLGLSLAMGFSTVRNLVTAIAPVFAAGLWLAAFPFPAQQECDLEGEADCAQMRPAVLGAGVLAFGALGYCACQPLLEGRVHYEFSYYNSMGYANWQTADLGRQLQKVMAGLLGAMGFEGGVPLLGVQGMLNALVLLELLAAALLIRRALRRECRAPARMGLLMLIFAGALSLAMFVLLRATYFDRYWLPVMMLGAPVMAVCLTGERNAVFRRMAALLLCAATLLTSASCMFYSMRSTQVEREMRMQAVHALEELGIGKGYATFWNASILTELSDGRLEMVPVQIGADEGNKTMTLSPWLTTEESFRMDRPEEPVALLLGQWERDGLDDFLESAQAQMQGTAGLYELYVVATQRRLFEAMGAQGSDEPAEKDPQMGA